MTPLPDTGLVSDPDAQRALDSIRGRWPLKTQDLADNSVTSAKIVDGTIVNADINASAEIVDTKLASPNNGAYKTILRGGGVYPSAASGVGYFPDTGAAIVAASLGVGLIFLRLDPADFAVASKTTVYRLRAQQTTAGTAPGQTLTVGMYPVTAVSAGNFTVGTVTSGSTVAFTTTAANTIAEGNSGDFTAPSAGYFIFGVTTGSATAGGSAHNFHFQLQTRNT